MRNFTLIIAWLFIAIGAMAQVTDVKKLSNKKCYHITAKDAARGAFYAPADAEYMTTCGGTYDNYPNRGISKSATDTNQHFAIIKVIDKYYLYSVTAKKFAKKEGNYIRLVEEPSDYITIEKNGSENNFYLKINGTNLLNFSGGYDHGVYANNNSVDDGNRLVLTEAGAFDPTEALSALNAFQQSWATNTIWSADLSEEDKPLGLPTRADNKDVVSVKKAETNVTIPANGDVKIGFTYTGGNHALNVIGVELVNINDETVKSLYEAKHAGGDYVEEVFTLSGVEAGNYTLRYFVANLGANNGDPNQSNGDIVVKNAKITYPEVGKYYRLRNFSSNYYATSRILTEGDYANKFAMSDNGSTAETIWYISEDNKLLSYTAGRYMDEMTTGNWNLDDNGHSFNLAFTRVIGAFQIQPSTERALFGDNQRVDAAGKTGTDGNYSWYFEEVTELPVTVTAAGYATLYAPVALTVPTGVTAHTVTLNGEWATLSEALTTIPANTGVVLAGAANTYGFTITTADAFNGTNALRGSVATTYYTEAGTYYALAQVDGVVGFYKDQFNNSRFQNNSHKAYLYVAGSANAASYSFRFGEGTTGIEQITDNREQSTAIYDLTGRRIEAITAPGIYVVNGKKVLVK
ncbi:MAG: hypothetical protein IKJ49_03060 [Bacteroidaceae bacterium]|nr:hypothetical protein [Bacteroidaceae bacterium]